QVHHRPLLSQVQLFSHDSSSETWWPWSTRSLHTAIRASAAMDTSAAATFSSCVRVLALGRAHFFHCSASPNGLSYSPDRDLNANSSACTTRLRLSSSFSVSIAPPSSDGIPIVADEEGFQKGFSQFWSYDNGYFVNAKRGKVMAVCESSIKPKADIVQHIRLPR
ncbi:hypothetical protein CU097_003573, partial [Rhizopus azygosporus]